MQNTEDVEWEKCHLGTGKRLIPGCGKNRPGCFDFYKINDSRGYAGCQTTTKSGLPCQKWSAQYPHKHRYGNPNTNESEYGQSTSEYYNVSGKRNGKAVTERVYADHNFCRNPSGNKDGPWCYTNTLGKRWETCNLNTAAHEKDAFKWLDGGGVEKSSGFCSSKMNLQECKAWADRTPGYTWSRERKASAGDTLWYYPTGCFTQTFGGKKYVYYNAAKRTNGSDFECGGHYQNANCVCKKTSNAPEGCVVDFGSADRQKNVLWNVPPREPVKTYLKYSGESCGKDSLTEDECKTLAKTYPKIADEQNAYEIASGYCPSNHTMNLQRCKAWANKTDGYTWGRERKEISGGGEKSSGKCGTSGAWKGKMNLQECKAWANKTSGYTWQNEVKKEIGGGEKSSGKCGTSGRWMGKMNLQECKAWANKTSGYTWGKERKEVLGGIEKSSGFCSTSGRHAGKMTLRECKAWADKTSGYTWSREKKASAGDTLWYYPTGCFTQTFGGKKYVYYNAAKRTNGSDFECGGHYQNANCVCKKTSNAPEGCVVDFGSADRQKNVLWNVPPREPVKTYLKYSGESCGKDSLTEDECKTLAKTYPKIADEQNAYEIASGYCPSNHTMNLQRCKAWANKTDGYTWGRERKEISGGGEKSSGKCGTSGAWKGKMNLQECKAWANKTSGYTWQNEVKKEIGGGEKSSGKCGTSGRWMGKMNLQECKAWANKTSGYTWGKERKEVLGGIEKSSGFCSTSGRHAGKMTLRECKAWADKTSGYTWSREKKASAGDTLWYYPTGCFTQTFGGKKYVYYNAAKRTNGSDFDCGGHYNNANCVCKKNTGDVLWYYPTGCYTQTFGGKKYVYYNAATRNNGSDFECGGHHQNANCVCKKNIGDVRWYFPTGCHTQTYGGKKYVYYNSATRTNGSKFECGGHYQNANCVCKKNNMLDGGWVKSESTHGTPSGCNVQFYSGNQYGYFNSKRKSDGSVYPCGTWGRPCLCKTHNPTPSCDRGTLYEESSGSCGVNSILTKEECEKIALTKNVKLENGVQIFPSRWNHIVAGDIRYENGNSGSPTGCHIQEYNGKKYVYWNTAKTTEGDLYPCGHTGRTCLCKRRSSKTCLWKEKETANCSKDFPCVKATSEKGTFRYAFDGYCPVNRGNKIMMKSAKPYEKVEECAQLCKARDAKGFSTDGSACWCENTPSNSSTCKKGKIVSKGCFGSWSAGAREYKDKDGNSYAKASECPSEQSGSARQTNPSETEKQAMQRMSSSDGASDAYRFLNGMISNPPLRSTSDTS